MIQLKPYEEAFKEEFYRIVDKKLDKELWGRILKSSRKYLPPDFYHDGEELKQLILAEYSKLKAAYEYIKRYKDSEREHECITIKTVTNKKGEIEKKEVLTADYKAFYEIYDNIRDAKIPANPPKGPTIKLGIRLVKECNILTCPYCNRDYINCRGSDASGAQLDHFYNRSQYPVFALSLYNLVPSCGNCNRIKSDKVKKFVSPFDQSVDFNAGIRFKYDPSTGKIKVRGDGDLDNNLSAMKIEQAYEIHNRDVENLIRKVEIYNKSQLKEIQDKFAERGIKISMKRLKRDLYGKSLKPEQFGNEPLSKLVYDILKERHVIM